MSPRGFEPLTASLEGRCSIQLSYEPVTLKLSGWQDSNLRPPRPKRGAITGLRYTPKTVIINFAERQGLEPWRQLPVDRLAICSITTLAPLLKYAKELIFASANVTLEMHSHNIFLLFLTKYMTYLFWVFNS